MQRTPRITQYRTRGFDESECLLKLIPGEFAVSQYLSKESAPDHLAAVYRYNGAPSIRMAQKMVTALPTNNLETKFLKGLDKAGTGNWREFTHDWMATR